jgi:DNA polymerase-3 subunit delta'
MNKPINPKSLKAMTSYLDSPGQAVGLIGPRGLDKTYLAKYLTVRLLHLSDGELDKYPYFLDIKNEGLNSISIDEVRSINDFIILKVPLKTAINRVILIERAERLTLEAQNALLKNLEEPPMGTIFILTAESLTSLLPTITSRLYTISVFKPDKSELTSYYSQLDLDSADIAQAYLISDGYPGLMDLLLLNQESSLNDAAIRARKLLSSTTFERLSYASDLAKDKEDLINTLFVIKQMAKIGISSSDPKQAVRWHKILAATLKSENRLALNVQAKLVLTDYILSIA